MTLDDDDYFDDQYYIELASTTSQALLKNPQLDFVISLNFPYIEQWIKLPLPLKRMIVAFHNHVDFAFRKKLLESINYPPQNITIIRDDAPLMIPLYTLTNDSKILFFNNTNKYLVDRKCKTTHQSNRFASQRKLTLNGYNFLVDYSRSIKRYDMLPLLFDLYAMNKTNKKKK